MSHHPTRTGEMLGERGTIRERLSPREDLVNGESNLPTYTL
ncbi:unnamed protein product [Brassica rapa subsp. trilocularis]